MPESSEEWLARQKQKLQALRERENGGESPLGQGGNVGGYVTSTSHSNRNATSGHSSDKKQLVEELKTKQHTWKQEKTEKTTEFAEDDSDRGYQKTTYRIRSPERAPAPAAPPPVQDVTLHPIQIGTLRDGIQEARYYSETKRVEEVRDEPRRTERYYRTEKVLPPPPPPPPVTYETRSDYSRSQGYNTLTSEEEIENYRGSNTLKSRDTSSAYRRGGELVPFCCDDDYYCHSGTGGGRLRSRSFGGDQVWGESSYVRRADGREWREGSFNPSRPAAEIFREAIRNVAPDGEVIYTSRRYDTLKKCRESTPPPPQPIVHREVVHHHHHPIAAPLPPPPPPPPAPAPAICYCDDEDIVVTETYKRTKETRFEENGTSSLVATTSYPVRVEAPPPMIRYYTPPPSDHYYRGGSGGREVSYYRTVTEENLPPAAVGTTYLAPPVQRMIPVQHTNLVRSRSAHDFLDNRDMCESYGVSDGGGRNYYYKKTTTYEDDSQRTPTPLVQHYIAPAPFPPPVQQVAPPGQYYYHQQQVAPARSYMAESSTARTVPVQQGSSSSYQYRSENVTGPTERTIYHRYPPGPAIPVGGQVPAQTPIHTQQNYYGPTGTNVPTVTSNIPSANFAATNYQSGFHQPQPQQYYSSSVNNNPQRVAVNSVSTLVQHPITPLHQKTALKKPSYSLDPPGPENYYASNSGTSSSTAYETGSSYLDHTPNKNNNYNSSKSLQHNNNSSFKATANSTSINSHGKTKPPSRQEMAELDNFLKNFDR